MRTLLLIAACLTALSAQAQETDKWGGDDWNDGQWDSGWDTESSSGPLVTGFAELGLGTRLESSPYHDPMPLGDARLRLETEYYWDGVTFDIKADGLYDAALSKWQGEVRELSAQFQISEDIDAKVGRQILTWGTGDFLFLNDFFPKDWQSFFSGRDDEYLKAPSDAAKLSFYGDWLNLNLVWTPEFDPDNAITGERFSFFNPWAGQIIAPPSGINAVSQGGDEWALRAYKTVNGIELAAYGYWGYQKSPEAVDSLTRRPYHSRLRSLGASIRLPLGEGLFNAEIAQHDSLADSDGVNPAIPNSQFRALLGYEQEIITRLTGSVQLYLEHNQDHGKALATSPFPQWEDAQNRTLVTTRLTWRNRTDDISLSLFGFYSPSDDDGHLRPRVDYRLNDQWQFSAGMNLFFRDQSHSFFGQFHHNDNAYLRVRYNF